jgi:hypothetical protein
MNGEGSQKKIVHDAKCLLSLLIVTYIFYVPLPFAALSPLALLIPAQSDRNQQMAAIESRSLQ